MIKSNSWTEAEDKVLLDCISSKLPYSDSVRMFRSKHGSRTKQAVKTRFYQLKNHRNEIISKPVASHGSVLMVARQELLKKLDVLEDGVRQIKKMI